LRYEIATEPRRKPQRIKEAMVRFNGYPNKKLTGETVAEVDYQPVKCGRSYRLVVVRMHISVQKGELVLFEEIKYFFYITNHTNYRAEQIVPWPMSVASRKTSLSNSKTGQCHAHAGTICAGNNMMACLKGPKLHAH
jgi:hypothetical protein